MERESRVERLTEAGRLGLPLGAHALIANWDARRGLRVPSGPPSEFHAAPSNRMLPGLDDPDGTLRHRRQLELQAVCQAA
jgi:hypothetical protein